MANCAEKCNKCRGKGQGAGGSEAIKRGGGADPRVCLGAEEKKENVGTTASSCIQPYYSLYSF